MADNSRRPEALGDYMRWIVEALDDTQHFTISVRTFRELAAEADTLTESAGTVAADVAAAVPTVETKPARELPDPPLAPLTLEEFAAPYTFRDIPLQEDEDGLHVWSLGHHDREEFAAAVTEYDREVSGDPNVEPTGMLDVERRYAVVVWRLVDEFDDGLDDHDWRVRWDDIITAETPGAFPVTVVNR